MFDDSKSIEQLENNFWPTTVKSPTVLTEKCYHYRRLPVKRLNTEQTRLLIGQNIGLEFLIPKALKILYFNILAKGDFYPGDLLMAVMNCEEEYWNSHLDLKTELIELITQKREEIESQNNSNTFRQLLKTLDSFVK